MAGQNWARMVSVMLSDCKSRLLFVCLPFCALLLVSCSQDVPKLARLSHDAVILAFGDSLTYGSGVEAEDSYPAVLEALAGREVINAGVPGEVTAEGLRRLPEVLDEYQPDLLILCHGGNDLIRKQGEHQAAGNIRAMVRQAQQRSIPVLMIAVPKPGVFMKPAVFYAEVATEFGLPLQGDILADIESDRSLKSDTIHPNRAGYRLLAVAVFALLQEAGAL